MTYTYGFFSFSPSPSTTAPACHGRESLLSRHGGPALPRARQLLLLPRARSLPSPPFQSAHAGHRQRAGTAANENNLGPQPEPRRVGGSEARLRDVGGMDIFVTLHEDECIKGTRNKGG